MGLADRQRIKLLNCFTYSSTQGILAFCNLILWISKCTLLLMFHFHHCNPITPPQPPAIQGRYSAAHYSFCSFYTWTSAAKNVTDLCVSAHEVVSGRKATDLIGRLHLEAGCWVTLKLISQQTAVHVCLVALCFVFAHFFNFHFTFTLACCAGLEIKKLLVQFRNRSQLEFDSFTTQLALASKYTLKTDSWASGSAKKRLRV